MSEDEAESKEGQREGNGSRRLSGLYALITLVLPSLTKQILPPLKFDSGHIVVYTLDDSASYFSLTNSLLLHDARSQKPGLRRVSEQHSYN